MACEGIETISNFTISTFMQYPSSCDTYFYPKILGALFLIMSLSLFFAERKRIANPNLLSIMGISSLAVLFIGLIITLFDAMETIIFVEVIVVLSIFIVLWLIQRN